MSTQYAGASVYPIDYTIPDDGEPVDAVSVNVAFEALGDRTAFLRARLTDDADAAVTFGSTDTWVVPAECHRIFVRACGAGGGGGGGACGGTSAAVYATGGGGGGGAIGREVAISVTPGDTLEIIVGSGGAAGAGAIFGTSNPTDGGHGGDTIIKIQGGAELARFKGGRGGKAGVTFNHTSLGLSSALVIVPGGATCAGSRPERLIFDATAPTTTDAVTLATAPGYGGEGVSILTMARTWGPYSRSGNASAEGFAGGVGGTAGTSGTYPAGGPGGGGGGGPFAAATAGLDGGNGGGSNGGNGTAGGGFGNGGAGGGGGGGGGSASTTPGNGSNGLAGLDGWVVLRASGW